MWVGVVTGVKWVKWVGRCVTWFCCVVGCVDCLGVVTEGGGEVGGDAVVPLWFTRLVLRRRLAHTPRVQVGG